MDHDHQVVVVVREVVGVGRDLRHLVGLLQELDRDPLLGRSAALRRQHLRQVRVVGAAEHLEARQHADLLRRRPQQRRQALGDLVLDRLLLVGPQERDGLLRSGLGLDREAEEELVAVLVDRAALEAVLDRVLLVVAVGDRVDEAQLDLAVGRALVLLEQMAQVALVGDEVLDEARQRLARGLREVEPDLDRLRALFVHAREDALGAGGERVEVFRGGVGAHAAGERRHHMDGEDADEGDQDEREGSVIAHVARPNWPWSRRGRASRRRAIQR